MPRPRVALVIPTLNEEDAIRGVLAAVPREVVDEIVVADSGSTDRTVERARAGGTSKVAGSLRGTAKASWGILATFTRIAAEGRGRASAAVTPAGRPLR